MLIFTTCARCKEILSPTYVGQETHPTCEPTEAEQLARQFVDAIQRDDMAEAGRLEKLVNRVVVPALGPSALWYASIGWPVFPIQPNGKQPLIAKRDGGKGLHDATTDPQQVREWWTKYPEANIGCATGIAFDVIDVDGPTGIQSLTELGDDVLPNVHGKVLTPRGFHLYTLPTQDGNRAGIRPGIDYRSIGGYVVMPPSQIDLSRYQWAVKPSPEIAGAR